LSPHALVIDSLLRDLRLNFLDNVVLSSIMNGSDFDVCTRLLFSRARLLHACFTSSK
jgi:hypothetical protein